MQGLPQNIKVLFKRLMVLTILYFLLRLFFLAFNYKHFSTISVVELLKAFFYGFRFDFSAIVYLNFPLILIHLLPLPWWNKGVYQSIIKFLFYLVNIPFLIFNLIDLVYFRFTLKRTTADIFQWTGLGKDLQGLLPRFLTDYWYLIILFLVILYCLTQLYNYFSLNYLKDKTRWWVEVLAFFVLLPFFGVVARGGVQLRPISIISASDEVTPAVAPLVLNTSFTLLNTLGKNELAELSYFPMEKAMAVFSPLKVKVNTADSLKRKNVVVVIMESFSYEYISTLTHKPGYTPFLDSLMKESLFFTNAIANGKRSIEGIPAILASLPTFMENSYITSAYSGNQINGIAGLLKPYGYSSAFFHGGNNGTMGFDHFAKAAGFEFYFGKDEYGKQDGNDGNWGIYDEPFLQYTASKINELKQPFVSAFFSLSSHHPFTVPEKYKNTFKEDGQPIHKTLRYADFSLKRFFETIGSMPWYQNTIFVITADHTAAPELPEYTSSIGNYRIPLLIFTPDKSLKGTDSRLVQQADILPTILEVLAYPDSYISFGESMLKKPDNRFAVNYNNKVYQYFNDKYILQLNEEKILGLYEYQKDPELKNNLSGTLPQAEDSISRKAKAFIQVYNDCLIHNWLTVNTFKSWKEKK